jgi:transposase
MNTKAQADIRRKLKVFSHAQFSGTISSTCRYFGISREAFYQWKRAYLKQGEAGLINRKPCPENPKLRTKKTIEDKIIHLRTTYHLGKQRISWYLARYHDIKISETGVYWVLKRNGLDRLFL